eukprot:GHRQ01010144.1.p1 GENE.GHRQ01010144.1~~GHRQ01010144.1.p1  ORF type:complete len:419 (-),score=-3.27 GHRQ01010144.1:138-1394(-)
MLATVHLWKVKSHIGVVGNEMADTTAVAVAKGHELDEDIEQANMAGPSNNRGDMYWLYTAEELQPTGDDAAIGMAGETANHAPKVCLALLPEPNLKEALKSRLHKHCKLGQSNTDTIYHASWETMKDKIDHHYSHRFMTSSTVSSSLRKLVLQYRYGLLPTYKLLKRYKKSDSSLCPLCGQEDGGHHAMSGCSKLLEKATIRHNNVGSLIVEAIYAGEHGNQLVAADVGLNKRRATQGRPLMAVKRTICDSALSKSIPNNVRSQLQKHSIPDALLYRFDSKSRRRHYTVVEIKYCRDTQPGDQEMRAEEQHQRLITTLKQYDPSATVKHCNLLLGVGGAIHVDMIKRLRADLGVTGRSLEKLLCKLHFQSFEEVGNIWKHRRALTHNKLGAKKERTWESLVGPWKNCYANYISNHLKK